MSINGIMNKVSPAAPETSYNNKKSAAKTESQSSASSSTADSGVIYEPSAEKTVEKTYKQDTALVAKLKADAEQRTAQFRQMVETMMGKQGIAVQNSDSMWKALQSGALTVDRATAEAAAKEISEDGYWGVKQTSDRIVSFAEALTGGDPEKMEKMRDAFIKGYKQATGAWGSELPEISGKTYDAVMEKFDKYKEQAAE